MRHLLDQVTHCPLCSNRDSRHFARFKHLQHDCHYRRCRACGLVYMSPRPSADQLEDFYSQDYRVLYEGSATPTAGLVETQAKRASHLASIIRARISPKDHLDIGCGSGQLIQALQAACGCRSEGIEPGDGFREFARARGLKVYSSLEEWSKSGQTPDLITMSHVLEHVRDPVETLRDLSRALAPGGHLLVEVPNLYFHQSFEIAHNFAFSARTLKLTLNKAGFRVRMIKRHGIPAALSPIYLTVLAGKTHTQCVTPFHPGTNVMVSATTRVRRNVGRTLYGLETRVRTLRGYGRSAVRRFREVVKGVR